LQHPKDAQRRIRIDQIIDAPFDMNIQLKPACCGKGVDPSAGRLDEIRSTLRITVWGGAHVPTQVASLANQAVYMLLQAGELLRQVRFGARACCGKLIVQPNQILNDLIVQLARNVLTFIRAGQPELLLERMMIHIDHSFPFAS
jgi:hypothetical protein